MNLGVATADWAMTYAEPGKVPPMGGSGWIRLGQYLPHFDDVNFLVLGRIVYLPESNRMAVMDWNDDTWTNLDVILMQRFMNDGLSDAIKKARSNGAIIVQDVDDWYWGLDQSNNAWIAANPAVNKESNINHYRKIIQASDYVIASTPYLADRLTQFIQSDRIRIHENHADIHRYTQREHQAKERPAVGWFGSTNHRSKDLEILRGVLSQVEDEFEFVHVGHMPQAPTFWDGVGISENSMAYTTPLLTPDELYKEGFNYDIGIVPLSDKPFNDSKSWIKGLEYAAANIPFIASPAKEYERFKAEYGVGRIARRPADWIKHLRALKDEVVREGEAFFNTLNVQDLDVRSGALKLQNLLKSLL